MFARTAAFALLLFAAGVAAAGDSMSAETVRVSGAWARATPPGVDVGAAYFVVTNTGQPDRLVRVHAPVAARTEMHRTTNRDGIMRMQQEPTVPIAAGGETVFAPGGRHLMLLGLERPLQAGTRFPLALTFERAGTLEVSVEVRAAGSHGHAHDGGARGTN